MITMVMNGIRARPLLILAVALVAGVLLDHAFFGQGSAMRQNILLAQHASASLAAATHAPVAAAKVAPKATPAASPSHNAVLNKSLTTILAEHDRRQRMADLETFINNLGSGDYADALKRIRRIPGTNERDLASRLLVARWVQADPEAALNFASTNQGFEYIADDVFQAEAAADVQGALARANAIQDTDLRYMALRGVLSFMADTDPAAALQLAQTLGNFPGNESLASVIYRQWATEDPQAAALQAMQDTGDGSPWRSPVGQVARTWAGQDPLAAANWSISLTDPNAEAASISQVMRQWEREDASAAANWVNALPPGGAYDAAAAAMAFSMASNDPQDAVGWADNIADPTARDTALERVAREVMWRDPTNGMAVLEAAGVPANLIPPPGQRGPRGP